MLSVMLCDNNSSIEHIILLYGFLPRDVSLSVRDVEVL